MPPKRSAASAALGGGGPGPGPGASASASAAKRVRRSVESTAGTQRTLDAFFTSSRKTLTDVSASPHVRERSRLQPQPHPQEVIVIDDGEGEGEHQVSAGLPPEHRHETRLPTEEVPLGVRREDEETGEEDGVDTDLPLARRAEDIGVELANKLESRVKPSINRLGGSASPSNAARRNIVRRPFFTLFNLNFFGSLTANAAP